MRAKAAAVALFLTLLLAFGLRFHNLHTQSFWNDEGNSARLSERPLAAIIEGTASDIHPPLYYLILRGWRELAGDSEFGLRAFSAFAGVLAAAAAVALGRFCGIRRWGLAAIGLLTAVSPPLIYYSQETRMYALLGLLATLSSVVLLRWIDAYRLKQAAAYIALITAGLYTHYFFPAIIVAHNLIVALWLTQTRRSPLAARRLAAWIGMMVVPFLLYLPWLPIFLRQLGERGERATIGEFATAVYRWLILGPTNEPGAGAMALIAAAILLIWGIVNLRQKSVNPLILLLVPLLSMYASGATQPQFFKFLTTAVPPLLILIAASASTSQLKIKTSLFIIPLLLILLMGITNSLHNLYANPAYARADYRGVAARIAAENHPNAGIILDAPNQWEVFTYYHRDGAPVYPLPKGVSQPQPEAIAAELGAITAQHDRLYVLFWGEDQRDPQRLVERWLDEHAFKATEEWIGDVRYVVYAVPSTSGAGVAMETAVNAPFGESITLNGYAIAPDQPLAGDILELTLFWKTAVPLETRYKVFIHLLDADGNLIAQRDSEPGGNLIPTTIWQAGEQVVDKHGLLIPADAPPGDYTVQIGLYDIGNANGRLPIQLDDQTLDALPIAAFALQK